MKNIQKLICDLCNENLELAYQVQKAGAFISDINDTFLCDNNCLKKLHTLINFIQPERLNPKTFSEIEVIRDFELCEHINEYVKLTYDEHGKHKITGIPLNNEVLRNYYLVCRCNKCSKSREIKSPISFRE